MPPDAAPVATAPAETAPAARWEWSQSQREIFERIFAPQPNLTPSEAADEYRVVSAGPMDGQRWSNRMTPYLVEIMDFVGAPWARRGVVRKSTRVGYTEGVIGNVVLWTVALDPCPIAVVQPSDGEAKAYSKENVAPMIERNDELKSRIDETGTRSSDSTLTYKEFDGGFLSILGSASDKNMRRRSFRRVFVDEVDAMKMGSVEGDPLLRLQKRTDDYEDGVIIVGSTPTTKHISRIDREFERSDKRYWHVPCPHCDELQVLKWGGPGKAYGIKWDREIFCAGCGTEAGDEVEQCEHCGSGEFDTVPLPGTAHYQCEHCGERIEEADKEAMILAGDWIPTANGSIPGWHIDALISLFTGARWSKLVSEWLEAQDDPEDLQVFVNQVLAEAWEERGEKVEVGSLERRAEEYTDAEGQVVDVPDGVGVLTAAVDVQGSWLELLVRGWGVGEESWDVLHERIHGDPEAAGTWARLEALLAREYRHELGGGLRIFFTMIDAAYLTDTVLAFTKPRERRNVFACMGDKTGRADHPPLRGPTKSNAAKAQQFTIGTFKQKDMLFRRLRIERPGPRYIHLRVHNRERCNGFDANYFRGFEAEKKVVRRTKGSRQRKAMYVQVADGNEPIDLHGYNQGAFQALGAGVRRNMEAWVERARRPSDEAEDADPWADARGDDDDQPKRRWVDSW